MTGLVIAVGVAEEAAVGGGMMARGSEEGGRVSTGSGAGCGSGGACGRTGMEGGTEGRGGMGAWMDRRDGIRGRGAPVKCGTSKVRD